MEKEMIDERQFDINSNEEAVDLLIAISVVSKLLAKKLANQDKGEKEYV